MQSTLLTYGGGGEEQPGERLVDEEAEAYLRAKRHVDTLHRAKKQEKMIAAKK